MIWFVNLTLSVNNENIVCAPPSPPILMIMYIRMKYTGLMFFHVLFMTSSSERKLLFKFDASQILRKES